MTATPEMNAVDGMGAAAGGFPALSPVGQFLLKDVVLLGASMWTLGDALAARRDPGGK